MNTLQTIITFDGCSFDPDRMTYFTRYFSKYYYDAFHPNQGTEVILDVLKTHGKSGKWMDIGAGPATLFWSLMLDRITELHCTELHNEGLKVLDDFMKSDLVPQCYKDVMSLYDIQSEHLADIRALPRSYYLFDALHDWPSELPKHSYDLITAYGVFGLTTTPDDYKKCFGYVRPFVKEHGAVIGANWIRSQKFIEEGNIDNRFIYPQIIEQAAKEYKYIISHISQENIQDDPDYTGVLVWSLIA